MTIHDSGMFDCCRSCQCKTMPIHCAQNVRWSPGNIEDAAEFVYTIMVVEFMKLCLFAG